MAAMTSVAGIAAARADVRTDAAQHDALMTGNTICLTEPNGDGEIVLRYGADGRAMARLPSSSTLDGTWSIEGDASCIVWSYGPEDSCSVLVKRDGGMVLLEVGTDRPLGTVRSIVPGNAEGI